MTKRMLWYMGLILLCCGAMAMVVFAAAGPNAAQTTASSKFHLTTGTAAAKPAMTRVTAAPARPTASKTETPVTNRHAGGVTTSAKDNVPPTEKLRMVKEYAADPVNQRPANPLDQGNDTCPATVIASIPYTDTGTTTGMADNFTPTTCGYSVAPDVIYSYVAAQNGAMTVSLCGSSYDTILYVKSGGACPGTTEVACIDDFCGLQSEVIVNITQGETYYIIVDGYSTSSGAYVLNVTPYVVPLGRCCYNSGASCADNISQADCFSLYGGTWVEGLNCTDNPCPPAPPNDDCQNAVVVPSFPYTYSGDCTAATEQCALLSGGAYQEVWFSFTLSEPSDVTIDQCGTSPAFYNMYIVLDQSCPCSGNWIFWTAGGQTCSDGNWSAIWTNLAAGTYYWPLLVDPANGQTGPYTVNFNAIPYVPCDVVSTGTPEGEDCAEPDDYNGGCNSSPNVFQNVPCDAHIAGTYYFDGSFRDTDWYAVTTNVPNNFTMTVTSESGSMIAAMYVADCNNLQYNYTFTTACIPGSISTGPVGPGTYWLFVAPDFSEVFTCKEYDMVITSEAACSCAPAEDLTVLRGTGLANDVNLRWNATQNVGLYRVFGTTNMNNDGDPNNGSDPDWSLVAEVPAPAVPGYVTYTDSPLVPRAQYAVVHDCAPRGRCCYGPDPLNPSCASPVTQADCDALAGTFTVGLNCTDNPCPILPNDNCQNAIPVTTFPSSFTYDNTGATPDAPCLGWPAEVWYLITTTQTCNLQINFCGTTPSFTTIGIALELGCPCTSYILATSYDFGITCPDGNGAMVFENLAAGTYYFAVYSDPANQHPYTINFDCPLPPVGRCCYNAGSSCVDNISQADCQATYGGNWALGLNCTDNPCPPAPANDACQQATVVPSFPYTITGDCSGANEECTNLSGGAYQDVWFTFTLAQAGAVTIDQCGTTPAFGNMYIVLDQSCPCSGNFIFWNSGNNTSCDGNWMATWNNLAPGTYYWPLLVDPTTGQTGPYTVNFNFAVAPPGPVNDLCSAAIPIAANTPTPYNNTGAFTDGAWTCAAGGADIWYTFTATATQTQTVSLCGSSYDTAVMVLDGCGGTVLNCNDDSCGLQSQTTFAATSGTTYWIAVGGFASSQGAGTIQVTP